MNENNHPQPQAADPSSERYLARLERLVRLAGAALFWERLWRAILPPLLIIGLFLAVSFAGLWLELPPLWRIIGVALFGAAFLISLFPVLRLDRPSRQEALRRIDRDSDLAHTPASGIEDTLANAGEDLATQALWTLHRQRMLRRIARLRAGLPSPRMADFDRYALRAFVLVALIASAFVAGPEKYARLASAFDWHETAAASGGYRIDAWIDPPNYTGRPPVLLKLGTAKATNRQHPEKLAVPINSTVIVRASGDGLKLETSGGLAPPKPAPHAPTKTATKTATAKSPAKPLRGNHERRLVLHGDGQLTIMHAGALLGRFNLAVIPDKPPRIELTDVPHVNLRGSFTLSYKVEDDYGVTSAQADFSDPKVEGVPGHVRSLVKPPHIALALPSGPGGLGQTQMIADLSAHPWAGARVKMTLVARDAAGNTGESIPLEFTLPQMPFTKPIAQALVEQRRNLVLFPDDKQRVETALEALMIAPQVFATKSSVYLGLDVALNMLRGAKSDADLLKVANLLWAMATEIENGSLSEAERALRAAEKNLRKALQNNASDQEIRKLTQKLREAMNKFLNEYAKRQQQAGRNHPQYGPNGARSISRKDLQAMLDQMQQMASAGDRATAQRMLEQLQNMLDNLETAGRRQANPLQRQMNEALNQLDKMMQAQQDLRDQTYRHARRRHAGPGQHGTPQQGRAGNRRQAQGQNKPGNGTPSREALRQRQKELLDRLQRLQRQLRAAGEGAKGLDDARRAMQQAEKALGQGTAQGDASAVGAQGRALEALRRGTEQLAQSMQGQGQGEGGESARGEAAGGTDPLGRPIAGDSGFNPYARYNPMGVPAVERARRVLEELRRRLGDPWRSPEEQHYLERLLRRY